MQRRNVFAGSQNVVGRRLGGHPRTMTAAQLLHHKIRTGVRTQSIAGTDRRAVQQQQQQQHAPRQLITHEFIARHATPACSVLKTESSSAAASCTLF